MYNKKIEKKHIYILLTLIICIFIFVINKYKIPCIINSVFGIFCPGCGITRMFLSIIKLDFYQAFRYNIIVFLLLPLFVFYGFLEFKNKQFNKKNILNSEKYKFLWMIILIIVILFGILRNFEKFKFLAPTKL